MRTPPRSTGAAPDNLTTLTPGRFVPSRRFPPITVTRKVRDRRLGRGIVRARRGARMRKAQ
jgi:hypothetical protein